MDDELYLMHFGRSVEDGAPGVGSGRYPLGSGENPYQHDTSFLYAYREMKKQGLTDSEIIKGYNLNLPKDSQVNHEILRQAKAIALEKEQYDTLISIEHMKKHGDSNVAIAKKLGISEASVRDKLKRSEKIKEQLIQKTAEVVKKNVDERGYIDIGTQSENYINVNAADKMGVPRTRLGAAVFLLKDQGYVVHNVKIPQLTNPNRKKTTVKVLCPPGTQWADVQNNIDKIKSIAEFSPDKGSTFRKLLYPESISSDRVYIRYGKEGGKDYDGVIEIRPGVKDLSLGNSHYAQVRIAVDNSHYMKGMALYSDDIPDGYDVVYNTHKNGIPKMDVLKPFEEIKIGMNPDNPFGASIKPNGQYTYIDNDGKEKLGAINKLKEEGDWSKYKKNIANQFLSKQPIPLVERQLDISIKDKYAEFDDIMNVKNQAIKKQLLEEFASSCDRNAADLKATPFPGQTNKVILPIRTLKDDEIYAPTYKNGSKVALIRYPHGGIFEIPILTVNNDNKSARKILGNPIDAVGINSNVAEQLSGADFDGDTVVVIPITKKVQIQNAPALKELKDFDHKAMYPLPKGAKPLDAAGTEMQMGIITNLITDMSLKGAPMDELARAVKHSMVIIDAKKHKLDWKKSYIDNRISELNVKWRGSVNAGASTIVSKAKSQAHIPERAEVRVSDIDPETGKINYRESGRTYIDKKTGKEKIATEQVNKMDTVDDAFELVSKHKPNPKEYVYATFANTLKSLANEARKESLMIKADKTSESAKKIYANEIESLNAKLNSALNNAPKERQAQIIATQQYRTAYKNNPTMSKEDKQRLKDQLLAKARISLGASKKNVRVVPNEKEWEAIESNAISFTKLNKIINNMDSEDLKKHVFNRENIVAISPAQISRIKALSKIYTIAEIAEYTGFSKSTVSKALKGE